MHNKVTHCVLVLILILNGLAVAISCSSSKANKDEEVEIVTMKASPNKEYLATVYIVWGGGAAGYVYKLVNVRKRSDPFDPKKGIVLHMSGRTNPPNVAWDDDEHLSIKYSKLAYIHTQTKEWGTARTIHIRYVQE